MRKYSILFLGIFLLAVGGSLYAQVSDNDFRCADGSWLFECQAIAQVNVECDEWSVDDPDAVYDEFLDEYCPDIGGCEEMLLEAELIPPLEYGGNDTGVCRVSAYMYPYDSGVDKDDEKYYEKDYENRLVRVDGRFSEEEAIDVARRECMKKMSRKKVAEMRSALGECVEFLLSKCSGNVSIEGAVSTASKRKMVIGDKVYKLRWLGAGVSPKPELCD